MTSIQLQNISKNFSSTIALTDINLQVPAGELLFLLGPSGCGKSTLLKLVAGLLQPTSGRILFNGRDVTRLPTEKRNAVMCFQNYALWPHMTVRQNVAFGLDMKGRANNGSADRTMEALRLVQLDRYAERKPNALSGGQQQRAALARALAVEPDCLLLDEPLSNLDAKLRLEMRSEIRRICKAAGYTTLYVTHDQKEALSIADRIVLMKDGHIVQAGTPAELYYKPCNSFVADFIGQTNLLRGAALDGTANGGRVQTEIGPLVSGSFAGAVAGSQAKEIVVSIRPEKVRILSPGAAKSPHANAFSGSIIENIFLGESSEHVVRINGHAIRAASSPPILDASGEVRVEIDPADCIVLPE